MRAWTVAASVVLLLAVASVARAQPTHYQAILVGDRSSGLGTAFTGLANDASALYYNPAGLVGQEQATLTGGLILNSYDRVRILDGVNTSFGDFDVTDKSKPSYPAFGASTLRLGRRDAQGRRPYTVAFSTFRLRSDNRSAFVEMPDPNTGLTNTIEQSQTSRDTYYGISLARRFGERWSGGITLFLDQSSARYSQQLLQISGPDPFDLAQSRETVVGYRLKLSAYYGVVRLGALYRPSDRWQMGLMLQPPGFRLKAKASVRRQASDYDLTVDPPTARYFFDSSNVKARWPVPAEVRLGFAERAGQRVLLTQDLSCVLPTRDQSVIELDPATGDSLGALLFPGSTKRSFVLNASVGVQYEPRPFLMLQFGAFTDFSSVPPIPETSNTFLPVRLHRLGFSGSVVIHNQRRGLAIGLIGVLGRGRAQGVDLTANLAAGDPLYYRTPANGRTIYLSITGATQVIEELSTAAVERVSPGVAGSEGAAPHRIVMPWRLGGDPAGPAFRGAKRIFSPLGAGAGTGPAAVGDRVWGLASEPAPAEPAPASASAPASGGAAAPPSAEPEGPADGADDPAR